MIPTVAVCFAILICKYLAGIAANNIPVVLADTDASVVEIGSRFESSNGTVFISSLLHA